MAGVPESQQIIPELFKQEDQDIAKKIAEPFNTYVEQLNEILNNNLTFTDNMLGSVKTFNLKGESSVAFKYDYEQKPIGLWVIAYNNLDTPTEVLTTGVTAQWTYDGKGTITVQRFSGLTTGQTYKVTFIAISG
jgi:hypothetical protein